METNTVNQVLITHLNAAMEKTGLGIDKALDFTMEQTPQVISELLTFYGAQYTIYSILWGLVTFLLTFYSIKYWKMAMEEDECLVVANITGLVVAFFSFTVGFLPNLILALKVFLAPRVFILEQVVGLVK